MGPPSSNGVAKLRPPPNFDVTCGEVAVASALGGRISQAQREEAWWQLRGRVLVANGTAAGDKNTTAGKW
jgi:hypothetical protein